MNATKIKTTPLDTASAVALDDLRTLLPDWCRSLRATNKAPSTIDSYRRCGEALVDYLVAHGM
ncbi:MAG: hypothetical protein ACXV2J_04705, partial [Actinomycetes bacterium]